MQNSYGPGANNASSIDEFDHLSLVVPTDFVVGFETTPECIE